MQETESHINDISDLDNIQFVFEEEIGNYEIIETENLWDDEDDRIYRAFTFNRGLKKHQIVITPECFIKATTDRTPSSLIVEISNILICCRIAKCDRANY